MNTNYKDKNIGFVVKKTLVAGRWKRWVLCKPAKNHKCKTCDEGVGKKCIRYEEGANYRWWQCFKCFDVVNFNAH